MSDIVARLRDWRSVHLARLHLLMEQAADEMERLRADWPEQLQAHSVLIAEQEMEIERLRQVAAQKSLTVEERDVLREVCRVCADEDDVGCNEIAFVIDRMLARLGGESRTGSGNEMVGEDAAKCTVKSKKCPERERVSLTDAEREALLWLSDGDSPFPAEARRMVVVRGLLERMKVRHEN